jgi:AhpD family alkylhydroperoxidase
MHEDEFRATAGALAAAGAAPQLTDREKQLIGLAVTVTRGCSYCTGGRIRNAIESGIPRETIAAAIDLSAAVNAGVAVRTAILGTEAQGIASSPGCADAASV